MMQIVANAFAILLLEFVAAVMIVIASATTKTLRDQWRDKNNNKKDNP